MPPRSCWSPTTGGASPRSRRCGPRSPAPPGAGDRFAASIAVALAEGAAPTDAVTTAVTETAAFLAADGVAGLARPANTATLSSPDRDAIAVAARVRAAGGTVVATGGCF